MVRIFIHAKFYKDAPIFEAFGNIIFMVYIKKKKKESCFKCLMYILLYIKCIQYSPIMRKTGINICVEDLKSEKLVLIVFAL